MELAEQCIQNNLYNVAVELNSRSSSGYFTLQYRTSDEIRIWEIPYGRICKAAEDGKLSQFVDATSGVSHTTLWTKGSIPPLPYILQACMFLGTTLHAQVRDSIKNPQDWFSLLAIFASIKRPLNYPHDPRVAVIAGNMVNRGMTLTSTQAAFFYTCYMFMDTADTHQRGASNAQRAGRSFGNIREACERIRPLVLSTNRCIADALANENIQNDLKINNCTLDCLVSDASWMRSKEVAYIKMQEKDGIKIRRVIKSQRDIRLYHSVVEDAPIFTECQLLTFQEFANLYGKPSHRDILATKRNATAVSVSLRTSICANISFTESSAQKVANMRNYFMYPQWAGKTYHMIWKQEHVLVIKRNTNALNSPDIPKYFRAHNESGELCTYVVIH
jgi:hypothetical protein